jgi:arylsulfatase A-like enzyme
VSWPALIKPGISDAMISQVDFLASFATMLKTKVPAGHAPDSENMLDALLGRSPNGRKTMVKEGLKTLSITSGDWKYIEPSNARPVNTLVNIELGNSTNAQLFNLKNDIGEKKNLAAENPERVKELAEKLKLFISKGN